MDEILVAREIEGCQSNEIADRVRQPRDFGIRELQGGQFRHVVDCLRAFYNGTGHDLEDFELVDIQAKRVDVGDWIVPQRQFFQHWQIGEQSQRICWLRFVWFGSLHYNKQLRCLLYNYCIFMKK